MQECSHDAELNKSSSSYKCCCKVKITVTLTNNTSYQARDCEMVLSF